MRCAAIAFARTGGWFFLGGFWAANVGPAFPTGASEVRSVCGLLPWVFGGRHRGIRAGGQPHLDHLTRHIASTDLGTSHPDMECRWGGSPVGWNCFAAFMMAPVKRV
jgi:hypothetical protein